MEAASRAFWAERSRRRDAEGAAGRGGRPVRQFLGTLAPSDSPATTLQRTVAADAEARYLRLAGRRTDWSLRLRVPWSGEGRDATVARLFQAGVSGPSTDPDGLAERRRWMLGRLADSRVLVARELPLRICPSCRTPRTPETIVYDAQPGHAYLVRFAIPDEAERTSLLVWTDEVWKLLGTVALLVNPETPYVVARFTRRDTAERVILSRSALDRVQRWLPGSSLEVLEEKLGADLAGTTYSHPLTLEYPPLSDLVSPAGSVVASNDVSDSGTGIVTLTPSHGAGDAAVARAHRIEGPSVVGTDGLVESSRPHKYAGLELESAEAFILRDLTEGGSMFAELTVRRGVPYCAVCGSVLRWVPGRAWCLEPGRLSAESLGQFARLLPDDTVPLTSEVVPWSVSETTPSVDPSDPILSECSQCERLSTAATGERCACGGAFVGVRRRLLPAFSEAVDGWASARALDPSDPVRLYLPYRRRAAALLHHLAAGEALDAPPADVRLIALPTLPPGTFGDGPGQDAQRAALLRTSRPPRTLAVVQERAVQEARRLSKFWMLAAQVLDRSIADGFEPDRALAGHLSELAEEDRAFLSTFERMRTDVRRRYEAGDLAAAQAMLARFAEVELRGGYLPMVASRLAAPGLPPGKVAALRVLHHVLPAWVELYAPIAPFTMEALHRAFQPDGGSVFDGGILPAVDRAVSVEAEGEYDRWRTFGEALRVGRRRFGIPAATELPRAILLVNDEATATRLRSTAAVLGRLAHVTEVIVGSPSQPWDGQRIEVHPVLAAIQKTYGAQSARVVRILEQIPSRRVQDGVRAGTLSIALDGRQMPILPGMVEFSESLPDDVVPVPWGHGEILISLPPDTARHKRKAPALTLDGYRIVRHIERRLHIAGGVTPELVVVSANGPLGEEMAKHAVAVAAYIGIGQLAVNDGTLSPPMTETSLGRTRRGGRWRVYIPGVPVRPPTARPSRPALGRHRVPVFAESRPTLETVPFLEGSVRNREETVRSIVEQVDRVVGRPVVGPTKVGNAFDAGFTSFDLLSKAPYDQLSGVAGFGPFVAGLLVESFGGEVPAPPPRHRPHLVRPGEHEPAPPETLEAPAMVEPQPAPPVPAAAPPPLAPLAAPILAPPPAATLPTMQVVPVAPVPTPAVPVPPPLAPPPVVAPPPAPEPPTPEPPAAPPSGVRLSLGDREEPAWRSFLDATSAGHRGLCLSREFPERRRALLGPRDVEVVWLSNVGKGSAVRPGDLPALTTLLTSAMTDRGVTAIFVEGGEYLVRIHGVGPLADLLRQLDALARERSARVWWPINPALMPGADVDVLRTTVTVEGPESPT
ncbi:MAG: class I tRNA ligase family protein [Thermoplasmata archaeon]|nr:class I tRNA ligase family protein [Thermoplasmata archaeon]